MSDVVYQGTIEIDSGYATKNVQELQSKLDALDKTAVVGANGVKTLESAVNKGTQAIGGMNAASQAVTQLMRGNFVGALASGATAVRTLWTALAANPIGAIVLGISAFAAYVYNYFDGIKKRAEENKKAVDDFVSSFKDFEKARAEWENRDTNKVAVATKSADKTESANESERALKAAKAELETLKQTTEANKENYAAWLKSGGRKVNPDGEAEFTDALDAATKAELDGQKVVEIWENKLAEIYESRQALANKNAEDEKKKADELAEYEKKTALEVAEMKNNLARQKEIDAVKDPIGKLEKQKEQLSGDYMATFNSLKGVDGEKARAEIMAKIYELEKSITAEKEKQAETARNASLSVAEKEAQYAYDKLSAADKLKVTNSQLAKLEETRRKNGKLSDDERGKRIDLLKRRDSLQSEMQGAEAPATVAAQAEAEDDGDAKKPSRVRRMGTRSASSWFKKTMEARRDAMGVSRETWDAKAGKWTKDADGKTEQAKNETPAEKAAVQSEKYLQKIAEVLAGS